MADELYDSRPETREHIETVRSLMRAVITELQVRAGRHDASKLESPEVEVFDRMTPKLRGLTYGSDEYKAALAEMGPCLDHHYAENDHHPEHGDGTIAWMDLVQIIEMLCDWKAATLRHDDGDLRRSIEINAGRYGYGDEIKRLLLNTAIAHGWIDSEPRPDMVGEGKLNGLAEGPPKETDDRRGPLTAEQMKSRGDARRRSKMGESTESLREDIDALAQKIRDEDAEPALGPKSDVDDLQRRVALAIADWKPGVYCACMAKGMDPRHEDLPCKHADEHRVGLVDSAIRAAEHEAAQGPGHE